MMLYNVKQEKNLLTKIIFVLFFYSYIIRAFLPVSPIIAYLPYFIIWAISYLHASKFDGYLVLIIIAFSTSAILIDSQSAFAISYMLIGMHTPYLLCKKFKPDSDTIYLLYLYVLIPCFFVNYFFVPVKDYGNVLTYIPFSASGFKINILSQGGTVQGTSLVGIFLFLISSFNIYFRESKRKIDKLFLYLSLYFIIFSGSRAGYFSLLFVVLFIIINKHRIRKRITSIIFVLLIISLYSIELIFNSFSLGSERINSFLKIDNIGTSQGLSSGRSWLWAQHMSLFLDSDYYLGKGKNGFIYSLEMGDEGGSESPATDIIARYGLYGLAINLFIIYLFFYALKKNNIFGAMLMGAVILVYLGGGENCAYPPDAWNFPFFCLYFSSFYYCKLKR